MGGERGIGEKEKIELSVWERKKGKEREANNEENNSEKIKQRERKRELKDDEHEIQDKRNFRNPVGNITFLFSLQY